MSEYRPSRRQFLVHAAVAAVALPLLGRAAQAEAATVAKLPHLPLANPQAKALSYSDDAAASRNPAHKPGSVCANCQFFTPGSGACALFAGYSVSPKGWCSAWAKRAT